MVQPWCTWFSDGVTWFSPGCTWFSRGIRCSKIFASDACKKALALPPISKPNYKKRCLVTYIMHNGAQLRELHTILQDTFKWYK